MAGGAVKRKTERAAHAYAVATMRELGRQLTTGEWGGEPITATEALQVMGLAMASVARLGVQSVVNALDDALADALRRLTGG